MASDLSNIIKDDIGSTLESLLSVTTSISQTNQVESSDFSDQQCINVNIDFEFSKFKTTKWEFYIPSITATKFEFLMLGGIGDLKGVIDDEITDAVNEIISNICGSVSTNVNAQAFDDLGSSKFTVASHDIIQCDNNTSVDDVFKFDVSLGDENVVIFLKFEASFIPYISMIATGKESVVETQVESDAFNSAEQNPIFALLGEESVDNLKLLFDIKLKLSVRLGTKILLLKDVMNWDTGTIIELEQMVNEPLDILANGIKIGEGEAVIVEGKFGIKIKHIGDKILT